MTILLGCARGRLAKSSNRKIGGSVKHTTKPTSGCELCHFKFNVVKDHSSERLYVQKHQGCNWCHIGHLPVDRCYMKNGKKDIPDDQLTLASKLLEQNMPSSLVNEWLDLACGNKLSSNSVKSLRQAVMTDKHSLNGEPGANGTPATKLMYALQTTKNCEYTVLTGTYDEALDKVRVTKTKKTKRYGETTEDLKTIPKSMKDQVKNVVKGLDLGDGQFLLAVAWVTKESKLNHIKFPWLLGGDETFRTNAEKRPLARLVGMNMNNNILPFANSFIPSQQKWVFYWLWTEAYPALLDSDALKKTALILVDQNENNWRALVSNLFPKGTIYGNALARLCNWHKIDRNLVTKLISMLRTQADEDFRDEIVNWLYSFTSTVEDADEEKHYLLAMSAHIMQVEKFPGEVNPNLVRFIKNYVVESFLPDITRLCHRHYRYVIQYR